MSSNQFSDMRDLLCRLREAVGGDGLVGFGLNGNTLLMTHAKPGSGKQMFVVTFDGADDFARDVDGLIDQIADGSKRWFS